MGLKKIYLEHVKYLWRSQGSAFLATMVDFSVLLILVEFFSIYYVVAVAFGALSGGLSNFLINRYWAFSSNGAISKEFVRYFLVSLASLAWNVILVWFITEYLLISYLFSKIFVSILIGLSWNYPLHKYWVFCRYQLVGKKEEV